MNAIYARQSVDRSDSISVESQIEFCAYELKGELYRTYIDKGYSGKNTERPAFLQMMRDMEDGNIRKVVVYKLDRISRSVLDFSSMIQKFQQHKVEFVSTMEKFDTSSPMGRAMLSICIVFAQLERETIQRRVADAYLSRSQKSIYMGGRVPYGFRLSPVTLSGVQTSKYEAVPEQTEIVRRIYERYACPDCSCGDIARDLSDSGIMTGEKPWGRGRVAAILKNPVYVRADLSVYRYFRSQGIHIINAPDDFIGENGCYLYSAGKDTSDTCERGYLVLAPHEGIIPAQLWLKCREKSTVNERGLPRQKAKNTWLAGKIKCGLCGYALIDKHYTSGHRYLVCSNRMNTGVCPGPGTIYSDEVENHVRSEIIRRLGSFAPLVPRQVKELVSKEYSRPLELVKINNEINALVDRVNNADAELMHYINERIRELDGRKNALERHIIAGGCETSDYPGIDPRSMPWSQLDFEAQRQITEQLIRVIRITSCSISIEWNI